METADVTRSEAKPFLVGVGGWAYLPIKKANKLEVCSKLYDFVEVNSTFYEMPAIEQVKKWRRAVPEDFEFTVRANKRLTHEMHLLPTSKNFRTFDFLTEICRELHSEILHFQFPPSLKISEKLISQWDSFFSSVRRGRALHYAIELRSAPNQAQHAFEKLVNKYDLILTGDASNADIVPVSPSSEIAYTRVFGKGDHTRWEFDTEELATLAEKIKQTSARKKYVTFHNLTMYEDASRMKKIAKTGRDQQTSPRTPVGLASLERSISAGKLAYPAAKGQLLKEFGWRTYEPEPNKKEHVSKALEKLSDENGRKFSSPDDVIRHLSGERD
jgi:uncharacterized protein YecE (DUF72 family)